MSFRKLVKLLVVGSFTGALLAITAPPKAAIARAKIGCICTDSSSGKYKCDGTGESCIPGSRMCVLECDSE